MTILAYWREFALAALALLFVIEKAENRHLSKSLANEKAARLELAEKYRSAAALAKSNAEHWKRDIEARQDFITKEVSREYQTDLADLRRRYDAIRLRLQARTDTGLPGGANLPGVPTGAAGVAGTSGAAGPATICISPEQALAAETYRLQLIALQGWVKDQAALPR